MLAIMKVENERIAKFAEFETREAAEAHVAAHAADFPDAFVVDPPDAPIQHLRVVGETVTVDPPASRRKSALTYGEFRARFTDQEMASVRAAVIQDPEALDWALNAAADNSVNLDSDRTSAFLDKMASAGIIDADRKSEILA